MNLLLEEHLNQVSSPANLLINDKISAFRKYCKEHGCLRPYHHFAFGQSPYPPPPTVIKALKANVDKNSYLPTAGLPELREAVSSFYRHYFGLKFEKERVVISPGSKEIISICMSVLKGAVIIPTPGWVSYLPQAKIHSKQIITIPMKMADTFKLTPELLMLGLGQTKERQKILILNHPHNPTGAMY